MRSPTWERLEPGQGADDQWVLARIGPSCVLFLGKMLCSRLRSISRRGSGLLGWAGQDACMDIAEENWGITANRRGKSRNKDGFYFLGL